MPPALRFRYETTAQGDYVDVMGPSTVGPLRVATQNAGSTNDGIYYQVGGAGLNGLFAAKLAEASQLDQVNTGLRLAYDDRFGEGTWTAEGPSAQPPLTSFLIPLAPAQREAGVTALVYSVGPVLGRDGIGDESAYRSIYYDAAHEIVRARASGLDIDGFRITMLSTGIYAAAVDDPDRLLLDAARLIINGLTDVLRRWPALADVTILINSRGRRAGKEQQAFDRAVEVLGGTAAPDGFDFVVSDAER